MTQDQYLVSICIPTYNRCEYLKKSLDSIVSQEPFLDGRVEVVISDNASTDETEILSREYASKYSNLIYHRNKDNVRDINFPLVISCAHGMLRRLSNDTLVYHEGALEYLCRLVEENKENRPVVFLGIGNVQCRYQILDFTQAIHLISFWTTYIACFCIWSDDCQNIAENTTFCDLRLWQVGQFYRTACRRRDVLVDDSLLNSVQVVKGKDISYGLFNVFYKNYLSIISFFLERGDITQADYDFLEKDVLYHFFVPWIIRWEHGKSKMTYAKDENLKDLVFEVCRGKPYWKDFKRYYVRQKNIFRIKKPLRFIKHRVLHL